MDEHSLDKLSRSELVALVIQLRQEVAELRARLDAQDRGSKRQAAPFSKGKRKADPKRPGRQPGQGTFRRREAPSEEEIDRRIDVPLDDEHCPACGSSRLGPVRTERVSCTDLPDAPKPQVTEYRIEVRECLDCGCVVRGRHPEVDPTQRGATAHRVGLGVLARAHALHYGIGVPMRQVPLVLKELCGVSITQGALQRDALQRAGAQIGAVYDGLRAGIKDRARVFTDDTGWRVGGETAHLMGFETDQAAVYQIRSRHRNAEVRELIPEDYGGIMHTDRGRSYDARALELVKQQKCCHHILRSIDAVREGKVGEARVFGETLKGLIKDAIDLWHRHRAGTCDDFWQQATHLKEAFDRHLRPRALDDPDNQRLLDQLGWHHVGGNLLRFLEAPAIAEPTNNRAERALRPAVIARKVSQCSKNAAGANAYGAFKSVLETIRKSGQSMVSGLLEILRSAAQGAAQDPDPS